MESTRLFVGNLPADSKEDDLKNKFSPYGQVLKVELKERKFLQPPSCFAFVTVGASRHGLQKCIYELSGGYAWNGHPVTVDFAKESFLSRLERERLDPKNKNIIEENKAPDFESNAKLTSTYKDSQDVKKVIDKQKSNVFSKQNEESEDSDSSDSDSDGKETNLNKIVDRTNDVMKQFEQFSSVWQSSEDDDDGHNSDSSEEIFEAFKVKPSSEPVNKDNCPSSTSQSTSTFPEHNKSVDFVKFVKTRQPQVQSKQNTDAFPEVKISTFPKVEHTSKMTPGFREVPDSSTHRFENNHKEANRLARPTVSHFPKYESKNKKIRFDDPETGPNDRTTVKNVSEASTYRHIHSKETSVQSTATDVKCVKAQAKNHVDAENKRRNAMEEKIKQISEKRKAIKQALANVDNQRSKVNKKIIFSQDSDGEVDSCQTEPTHQAYQTGQRSGTDTRSPAGQQPERSSGETDEGKKDRRSLFDEAESESEDELDSEEEFKIKKQFEGEKGLKLLELQASYNNDTRFNLDDRFAEDDKADDRDSGVEGVEVGDEQDEKAKQMRILENVLGYRVKQHQTKNGLHTIPRFDPMNPECKSLLQVKLGGGDRSDRKRKRRLRDAPVEVSGETFYQLDEAYFTSSKEKKPDELDEPFSLLKMLNRDNVDADARAHSENFPDRTKVSDDYRTEPLGKTNPFVSVGARFEYDSSDSEDEEDKLRRAKRTRIEKSMKEDQFGTSKERAAGQFGTGLAPPPSLSEKMFFLHKDDDRLKEAQEFWKQKPSFFPSSGAGDSFKLKRRALALKLKTKIRRNLKNSSLSSHMKRKKTTKMMRTQRRRS